MRRILLAFLLLCSGQALWAQGRFNLKFWGNDATTGSIDSPIRLWLRPPYFNQNRYFAVLCEDSTVVCWGGICTDTDSAGIYRSKFTDICADEYAFQPPYDAVLGIRKDGTVLAWTHDSAGTHLIQTYPFLQGARGLSGSASTGLAVMPDSTVRGWSSYRQSNRMVPAGLRDVVKVQYGIYGSLALLRSGQLVAWSDTTRRIVPASARVNIKDIVLIDQHLMALRQDSTVVVWEGLTGTLIPLPAAAQKATAIGASGDYLHILRPDSTVVLFHRYSRTLLEPFPNKKLVRFWGFFTYYIGMQPDGTLLYKGSSTSVLRKAPIGLTDVKDFNRSLDASGLIVIRKDNTISSWGYYNQPAIPRTLGPVKAVAQNGVSVLCVRENGTVVYFGDSTRPVAAVPVGLREVKDVVLTRNQAIALKKDGSLVIWGITAASDSLARTLRNIVALKAGYEQYLALTAQGKVVGWTAPGGLRFDNIPANLDHVVSLSASVSRAFALKEDGTVVTWDLEYFNPPDPATGLIPPWATQIRELAWGNGAVLVRKPNGRLAGWGHPPYTFTADSSGFQVPDRYQTAGKFGELREGIMVFIDDGKPMLSLKSVEGSVFETRNTDCIQDSDEPGIPYRVLKAEPGPYFGMTDTAGRFRIPMDSGSYQLSQQPDPVRGFLSRQTCPTAGQSQPVAFSGTVDTLRGIRFANDVRSCPLMQVSLGSDIPLPCSLRNTQIRYSNDGNDPQNQVVAHVRLPAGLVLKSASMAYSLEPDSSYSFALGTVAAGASGVIQIQDSVRCDAAQYGKEMCTNVWLTPGIVPCQWPTGYDGSIIELDSRCGPSGIEFTVRNLGQAMRTSRRLRIYKGDSLALETSYNLISGDTAGYAFPHTGLTLQAELDSLSPAGRWQVLSAPCSTSSNRYIHHFLSAMPGVMASDCQQIRTTSASNQKQVQPAGLTAAGYVEPGTWLRYRIRFMNKGTDTAYTVRIVDTLSESVDIASLRFGASSHRYIPTLSGKGRPVINFRFTDINLPDSIRSGAASQGFVDFSVRTHPDAPLGTEIRNFADIYFDYNDPVRTNTTLNTLYRPVVVPGLIDTLLVSAKPARRTLLRVEPNPAHTGLRVLGAGPQPLELLNAEGRRMLYHPSPSRDILLNIESLPVGLYLLRQGSSSIRVVKE